MTKKYTSQKTALGIAALSMLAVAIIPAAYAATDTATPAQGTNPTGIERQFGGYGGKHHGHGPRVEPTAEEKALFTELKTARENNDTTKVTGIRTKLDALREAAITKREAALDTAIAGGYDTWKAYVTAQKELPQDILTKITADNFSTFATIHQKEKELRALKKSIGLDGHGPQRHAQ